MAAVPQSSISLRDMSLFREQAFVGGRWESAANGQVKQVFNPATGERIGTIPNLGAAETRRAIEAADKALPDWRARTAKERAQILRKWFELMMANQEDLAVLMTVEQGKPLFESRGEIAYAASFIEWFAEEGKRAYGDVIPSHGRDKRIVVLKQAIGVTAAITPWNFPAAMITRKVGPALAAGCTMVVKPAELTPYSALAMCVLAERAGIPAGVLSVVTGDSKADRRRAHQQSDRSQAELHGLDRGRQAADGAVCCDGEEDVDGARRQRAVHRVRRRGSGSRGRRRNRVEVSQRRSDLRVRESHLRASRHLRPLRTAARGSRVGRSRSATDSTRTRSSDR